MDCKEIERYPLIFPDEFVPKAPRMAVSIARNPFVVQAFKFPSSNVSLNKIESAVAFDNSYNDTCPLYCLLVVPLAAE